MLFHNKKFGDVYQNQHKYLQKLFCFQRNVKYKVNILWYSVTFMFILNTLSHWSPWYM